MTFHPKGLLATAALGAALLFALDGELTLFDIALDLFLMLGLYTWLGDAWPTPAVMRRILPWRHRVR